MLLWGMLSWVCPSRVPEQGPESRNSARIPRLKPTLSSPAAASGALPALWVVKAQKQQKGPQNPVSGRKSSGKVSAEPPSLQIPQLGHPRLPLRPHPGQHEPCSAPALGMDPAWEGLFPRAFSKGSAGSWLQRQPCTNPAQLGATGSCPEAPLLSFPILPGWETGFNPFLWSGMSFPSSVSHPLPWTWRAAPRFGSSGTLGALGCFRSPGESPRGTGSICDPKGHLWNEGLWGTAGAQDGPGPGVQELPSGEGQEEFGRGS